MGYDKLRSPVIDTESVLKINWRQGYIFILIAAVALIADQVSKALIRANMTLGESIPDEGRFRLSYSTNEGGVFGLSLNSTALLVFSTIMTLVIIWLYFYHLHNRGKLFRLGLGLVLGGALGNLADRIRTGEVTDFIDVRLWGTFHWPTFNIADASLTTGMFILAYSILITIKHMED